MAEPRDLVEGLEAAPMLPEGSGERFSGYGVMACPFSSGHILCHRRFPASSIGPAYTSVWHRDPAGGWTFYQDVPPAQACPRFFGSAIAEALQAEIDLSWTAARSFRLRIDGGEVLDWEVLLAPTAVTRSMNAIGSIMPDALWRNPAVLRAMASFSSVTLQAGRLGLTGRAPNGQQFMANPLLIWTIAASRAVLRGEDLGTVAPTTDQARLGDFWVPRRGLFVIGHAYFEAFDASRHLSATRAATS